MTQSNLKYRIEMGLVLEHDKGMGGEKFEVRKNLVEYPNKWYMLVSE